jgi:hypothetical protein
MASTLEPYASAKAELAASAEAPKRGIRLKGSGKTPGQISSSGKSEAIDITVLPWLSKEAQTGAGIEAKKALGFRAMVSAAY